MQKIIVSALAALSLGFAATPASAETTSVKVPYADLDLTSAAGQAELSSRIETASRKICGKTEVRNVHDGADQQRCVRETQASVSLEIARITGTKPALALNTGR